MATCPYCGTSNPDGATSCEVCGGTLPTQTAARKTKKGKSGKNGPIRAIVSAILALTVLGGGGVLGYQTFSASGRLDRAIRKTYKQLITEVRETEPLKYAWDHLEYVTKHGRLSLNAELTRGSDHVTAELHYSQPRKAIRGSIDFSAGSTSGSTEFSVINDVLQLEFPSISRDVYGISLKKNARSSAAGSVMDLFGVDLLSVVPENPISSLKQATTGLEKTWKKVWKYVSVESRSKQGELSVFRASWSERELQNLIRDKEIGGVGKWLIEFLTKIDGGCMCYVNKKGTLVRVEAVIGTDIYTLSLDGTDQLWETFTISSTVQGKELMKGGVNSDDAQFHAWLNLGSESVLDLSYQTSSGKFTYVLPNASGFGRLTGDKTSASVELDLDGTALKLEFGKPWQTPKRLATKYINIQKMSVGEIARLAIQFGTHSGELKEYLRILSSYLQPYIS